MVGVKDEWAAWSDTFNSYSLTAGIGSESEIRYKIQLLEPYSLNQFDWRPVRIPPPSQIEATADLLAALEEVVMLARIDQWHNEDLVRHTIQAAKAAIAKANGEGE